jgi:hypothetical protein
LEPDRLGRAHDRQAPPARRRPYARAVLIVKARRGGRDAGGRRDGRAGSGGSPQRWPQEFRDGKDCAFLLSFEDDREAGGYPLGFHHWPLDRRNAWFAGFNQGFHDRLRFTKKVLGDE